MYQKAHYFMGYFNMKKCLRIIKNLFNKKNNCKYYLNCMNKVPKSKNFYNQTFYVIYNFYIYIKID